jgi:hypothetical protein
MSDETKPIHVTLNADTKHARSGMADLRNALNGTGDGMGDGMGKLSHSLQRFSAAVDRAAQLPADTKERETQR